jgi:superfamily II DNA or RNA helicase
MTPMKVQWNVLEVLAEATVKGSALTFAQEYDRKLYEATKQVLEAIGGQWDRYAKAFLFPGDAAEIIAEIVRTGEVMRVVPMGAPTNDEVFAPNNVIPLAQFVTEFGDGLMQAVSEQNPPIYDGTPDPGREAVMDGLKRHPFPAQRQVVQAVAKLLLEADEEAAIVNAEMGTGKTMMAICIAAVMRAEGYRRTLIISPPHLVYKWRREILETVPNTRVWVLNGPDTLRQLLTIRATQNEPASDVAEFYVIGRVRMRMGFDWTPVAQIRKRHVRRFTEEGNPFSTSFVTTYAYAACPDCGSPVLEEDGAWMLYSKFFQVYGDEQRRHCAQCGAALWSLKRPDMAKDRGQIVQAALCQLPTIGPKTAEKLVSRFGADTLAGWLDNNPFDFINLMDEDGELVFGDRQARRLERSLANQEFAFGQGGYQATEFVKRYLPQGFFDLLVVDEGHEYKDDGSAQGQAMGVLAAKCRKTLLLTGTLMGGYADDLFFLMWRILTRRMQEDGFKANRRGRLAPAALAFMREHGVLKDVYRETDEGSHRTAKGKKISVHTKKAPGFGPKGIARYVLPYTVFLKLRDIGGNVLPPYEECFLEIGMTAEQEERYRELRGTLVSALKEALRKGDKALLGVVLNALLAWPDGAFREEVVKHPRNGSLLAYVGKLFEDLEPAPKERELIRICREQQARGRRVLIYTVYTGTRDTTGRLKTLLQAEGFRAAVLRASVETAKREDWILEQVDRGLDALICNPDLVKTGLDLLDFPVIVFMQSGYSVYTVQQAARRSWRIGQKHPVEVFFLGYAETAQIDCLSLMAKKIAVSQSTSGEMPETGLDVLNQDGDSLEVALAKRLIG